MSGLPSSDAPSREPALRPLEEITAIIIDASIQLHRKLGTGLMESVYETILARELERRGLTVERQKIVTFEYEGMIFDEGLRLDLFVDNRVIIELKSVEHLSPVHSKQVLTYLRLMHQPLGLLINFGAPILKEGLKRIVNDFPTSEPSNLRINQSNLHGRTEGAEKSTSCLPSAPSAPPRELIQS